MNTKIRSFAFCLIAYLLACSQSWAQRGPQDTWYEARSVSLPNSWDPYDLLITSDGNLLISDIGNDKIHELDENGSLLNSFGSLGSANGQFNNPLEMVLSSQNKIYVADQNNHRVQVLERNGTFVKTFGTNGTGDGQFNKPWGLAISSENEVFVVDKENNRIQVFDENGTFLRKWGSAGSLDGQFNAPHGLAFTPSDLLLTVDTNNNRLVSFDTNGNHIGKFALYRHYDFYRGSHFVSYLTNGLIFIGGGNDGPSGSQNYANIYDQKGNSIKRWKYSGNSSPIAAMAPSGDLLVIDKISKKLFFYKQTYRTLRSSSSKDAPLPEVISVKQPAGTNHLEIKYRITDADSAKVKAGLLAFKDGGNDLTKVIVPKTFVGSIAGKLDENTTTGTIHTVTWDAKADWNVTYGDIEVAVVAQDDRDLMNIHFLTLPATDNNSTELKISRSPIVQSDFLNAWYTLLALGDEGITLENGQIKFVATGQLGTQTNGTQTNALGRPYILDKMNLRQATTAEITRAKEAATPGVTNQFEPAFKVGPGERPVKVNEYGFDTGTYSGSVWWLVPKN